MHDGRRVRVVRPVVELLYRSRRILEVIKSERDGFNVDQWFKLQENVRKCCAMKEGNLVICWLVEELSLRDHRTLI